MSTTTLSHFLQSCRDNKEESVGLRLSKIRLRIIKSATCSLRNRRRQTAKEIEAYITIPERRVRQVYQIRSYNHTFSLKPRVRETWYASPFPALNPQQLDQVDWALTLLLTILHYDLCSHLHSLIILLPDPKDDLHKDWPRLRDGAK